MILRFAGQPHLERKSFFFFYTTVLMWNTALVFPRWPPPNSLILLLQKLGHLGSLLHCNYSPTDVDQYLEQTQENCLWWLRLSTFHRYGTMLSQMYSSGCDVFWLIQRCLQASALFNLKNSQLFKGFMAIAWVAGIINCIFPPNAVSLPQCRNHHLDYFVKCLQWSRSRVWTSHLPYTWL